MLSTVFLMAALIGQTTTDGPVLSEATKQAHARALAEFRANEHTIKPRLEAYHQLENHRLTEKTATVNVATGRVLGFAAGAKSEGDKATDGANDFSSVPPKGRLRDSRYLYRESNWLYRAEYPIRAGLAGWGQR